MSRERPDPARDPLGPIASPEGPAEVPAAGPPTRAVRLLARALRGNPAAPAILGDLHEDFVRLTRERGARAANRWYRREALTLAVTEWARSARDIHLRAALQDGTYAVRAALRAPAASVFIALTMALGVGAATTVYSVVEPLLLAPLPFRDAERLVWISNRGEPGDNSLSAVTSRTANLRDFGARSRAFAGLTGYNAFFDQRAYTLTGAGEPERLQGVAVAYDFLDVLGVTPLLGRGFTAEEGERGGPPALVLGHGFWTRRFAADPTVVGRTLVLNARSYQVVGVLPPSFDFASTFTPGSRVDFLLPMPIPGAAEVEDFQGNVLFMIGRLAEGVTAPEAQADLEALVATLQQEDPARWGLGAVVTPLREQVAGPVRPALLLLALAAGSLLAIVCVNVGNLILARAPGRAREVAVRKALGASRARLVRQLLMETLLTAGAGALLGAGAAAGAVHLVSRSAGLRIPLLAGARVDGSALLFAAAVALLAALLVGLAPALRVAEGGESTVLKGAGRGNSAGRGARRLREGLIFAQVTLACVLLLLGGLLVRSFQSVMAVELGYQPDGAVAWTLSPARALGGAEERAAFHTALAERVRATPGVDQAGLIDGLPLGRNRSWGFSVPGVPEEQDTDDQIFPHIVDPGYLGAMRIPLLAGRNLAPADRADAPRAVLINESGARRVFGEPAEAAVGRRIAIWNGELEVVGVVRDVRNVSPEMAPGIQVYFPLAQMPDYQSLDLVVRSRLPTAEAARVVAAALREVAPDLPTGGYWTLESTVARSLSARRFTLAVLAAFGSAALVLAGLGIYGVLAQSVAEQRGEIGIRIALGATAPGVVREVLGRTLVWTAAGVVAGVALALTGARLMASLLYGVSPVDPLALAGTALLVLSAAALAAAIPARRAARTPGSVVLQLE